MYFSPYQEFPTILTVYTNTFRTARFPEDRALSRSDWTSDTLRGTLTCLSQRRRTLSPWVLLRRVVERPGWRVGGDTGPTDRTHLLYRVGGGRSWTDSRWQPPRPSSRFPSRKENRGEEWLPVTNRERERLPVSKVSMSRTKQSHVPRERGTESPEGWQRSGSYGMVRNVQTDLGWVQKHLPRKGSVKGSNRWNWHSRQRAVLVLTITYKKINCVPL